MSEDAVTPMPEAFELLHAALLKERYRDVEEFRGLKVGARVHHVGERYAEAVLDGTATVLAVMHKKPSSWEQSYGRPDVELLVRLDDRLVKKGMPEIGQWADYHTRPVQGGDSGVQ